MLNLDEVTSVADVEDAGRVVEILGVDGLPMMVDDAGTKRAATMRIRGTYSKAFTAAQNKVAERNRRRPKASTTEQDDQDNYDIWGACVVSWELLIGGKEADRTTVFKRFPNIYQQVTSEARDHVSFSEMASSN